MRNIHVIFASIVVVVLVLSTGLVVAISLDENLKPASIKANLPINRVTACSSISGKFDVNEITGIVGTGVSVNETEAVRIAKEDFLGQKRQILNSVDRLLICGEGCSEEGLSCDLSDISCQKKRLSGGRTQAFCNADISCEKECLGEGSEGVLRRVMQ